MLQVTRKDIRNARQIYWVILFLTPVALFGLQLRNQIGYIALYLIILYMILQLLSKKPLQKAHAVQGLVLTLVLVTLISLRIPRQSFAGFLFTVFAWLAGSIAGLRQAGKGRAWIGKVRAEILPDRRAAAEPATVSEPVKKPAEDEIKRLLDDFRSEDPSRRAEAVIRLDELGQVDTF